MKKVVLRISTIMILVSPWMAQAKEETCIETFRRMYEVSSFKYQWGFCSVNIESFLKHLDRGELSLTKVLLISREGSNTFSLAHSRTTDPLAAEIFNQMGEIPFHRHFVALNRGVILDFDLTDSPNPVPARDYFDSLIRKSREQDPNVPIQIQEIPGSYYRRFYWMMRDSKERFPPVTLEQYKDKLKNN